MERGLITALLVTAAWIILQIVWMHVRPARNRFLAMLTGYLVSLPAVLAVFAWLPLRLHEPWGVGLFFAYLLHLLLFFLYVEGFYHVERSVTLRFLVEILERTPPGARLEDILGGYNVDGMIRARLAALEENGFIELEAGVWRLLPKGARLARVMRLTAWIYQTVGQADRL